MTQSHSLTPDEDVDRHLGRVLQDRYRVLHKLGAGGMGAVYEGEHLLTKRRVAIKILHAAMSADPKLVKRFHNEAQAATAIGHPNIVEVIDLGRLDDGTAFMVLELLSGRDFESLIESEGPQPIGRTVHIVMQLCEALRAAHERGIVHRDLKPENLFLLQRPDNPHFVKVLDFGVAKFNDPGEHRLTQTGQALGTPYFMSPEQLTGSAGVDQRADLYSIGVILYHALTAAYPFHAQSFPMLVVKICNEPPPPLRTLRPDVPEQLEQIVASLLAKSPDGRPSSALQLREWLAPFRVLDAPAPLLAGTFSGPAMQSGVRLATGTPVPQTLSSDPGLGSQPAVFAATAAAGMQTGTAQPGGWNATGPLQGSSPGLASTPGFVPSATNVPQDVAPVAATPSKLPMFVALAALVVALVVVGIFVAIQLVPRQPIAATPEPPPEPSAPAVERVHVSIETEPADAELFLDGDPIGNPFDGELDRTDSPRTLEARREGRQTITRQITLRFPQHVRLVLPPIEAPAPEQPAVAEPATPAQPVVRRQVRVAPQPVVQPMIRSSGPSPSPAPPGGGLKQVRF